MIRPACDALGIRVKHVRTTPPFNAQAFLDSAGVAKQIVGSRRAEAIFSEGDPCDSVMYIQKGGVKLSVCSAETGREAVIAMLGPGEFFGEGCLAGQPRRMGNATAITASTILVLKKEKMVRLLRKEPALADRFITHMLSANIRREEELLDQLFDSHEKRLAQALLLLARYEAEGRSGCCSLTANARNAGASPARVVFFMKKFKLGFIDDRAGSRQQLLLSVVLHD